MRNSVLGCSAILALAFESVPAANAVMLSVVPQHNVIHLGSTGVVDVVASDLTDAAVGGAIGGYDFNITFDPAILSYSATTFGPGLDVTHAGDSRDSGLNGPGKLETFEVSLDSPHDLAVLQPNTFVLFSLAFSSVAPGASSLGLSILSLTDESGNPLAADIQNSSLAVAPVPLPAAGWLLLSGLGGAFALRRQRRSPVA